MSYPVVASTATAAPKSFGQRAGALALLAGGLYVLGYNLPAVDGGYGSGSLADGDSATAWAWLVPGLVAVVTGGLGSIGLATAQRLAAEGARVALIDLEIGDSAAALAACREAGAPDALALACDVADETRVEAVCATVRERFGALDRAVQKRRVAAVYAVKKSKSENAFSLCHE